MVNMILYSLYYFVLIKSCSNIVQKGLIVYMKMTVFSDIFL
jgi:hypothetical protein